MAIQMKWFAHVLSVKLVLYTFTAPFFPLNMFKFWSCFILRLAHYILLVQVRCLR